MAKRFITLKDNVVIMVRTGNGKNDDEVENDIAEVGQVWNGTKFIDQEKIVVVKEKLNKSATQQEKLDYIIKLLGGEIIV